MSYLDKRDNVQHFTQLSEKKQQAASSKVDEFDEISSPERKVTPEQLRDHHIETPEEAGARIAQETIAHAHEQEKRERELEEIRREAEESYNNEHIDF